MPGAVIAVLDDPDTADKVAAAASRLGLSVVLSLGGRRLAEEIPQCEGARLLVMELEAPRVGGLEACRQVRGFSDIPIIALGDYGDKTRVVEALRAGADCYLSKPMEAELLEAHMGALVRRWSPAPSQSPSVTVRGLTVDFGRKEIRLGGDVVPVTPAEFRLLACLASQLGRVVASSELLREMSGYNCSEQEAQEIVKVHVSRLRSKIDRDPSRASYLLNVRGFGYMLERRSSALS